MIKMRDSGNNGVSQMIPGNESKSKEWKTEKVYNTCFKIFFMAKKTVSTRRCG